MNSIANDSNHTNQSGQSKREEMIASNNSQSKLVVEQKLISADESNYSDVITSSYVRGYN
ncbi:hypothetical protein [Thalassotalea sp. ND16A]|uniref:hypothetical protein n=1 Tax=Thalassotalea sp. ND16A TaxID=1535422 RepID=UPI00051A6CAA|nr:hypothetical protein [Thalassotalea sp. ND16A]KGJ89319.1 hypothetical protein ND16A_2212 [Thalassotalea sp. ND16A]